MRVVFIRHGESRANASHQLRIPRTSMKLKDADLTRLGREQAVALRQWEAAVRARADFEPELMLVSPLRRALRTALEGFPALEIPWMVHPALKEFGGNLPENIPRSVEELTEDFGRHARFQDIDFSLLPETWPRCDPDRNRTQAFTKWLDTRTESLVIVVCHHNVIASLLAGPYWGVIENAVPILTTYHGAGGFEYHEDPEVFWTRSAEGDSTQVRLQIPGVNRMRVVVVERDVEAVREAMLDVERRWRKHTGGLVLVREPDGRCAFLDSGTSLDWLKDGNVVHLRGKTRSEEMKTERARAAAAGAAATEAALLEAAASEAAATGAGEVGNGAEGSSGVNGGTDGVPQATSR